MSALEQLVVAVCGYLPALILQLTGRWLHRMETRAWRRAGVGLRIAAGVLTAVTTTSRLLRERRGKTEPVWSVLLIGAFAVACLLPGAVSTADGLMRLTGLARPARLHVTAVTDRHPSPGRRHGVSDRIDGEYVLGGAAHRIENSARLSFSPLPKAGDTIPGTISRLWPAMMLESGSTAGVVTGFGATGLLAGAVLMTFTVREKKQPAETV